MLITTQAASSFTHRFHSTEASLQGLLPEIQSLQGKVSGLEAGKHSLQHLLSTVQCCVEHGPREDRLLRYQLQQMLASVQSLVALGPSPCALQVA